MKGFIVSSVFFITGLVLGAQESSLQIALPAGSWPASGGLTEMEVIHDLRGGAYIPHIVEGEFRILRTGEGGQLYPYAPEGFDGEALSARDLTVSAGGIEQYAAFIGAQGGREAVYLFGLSFRSDLQYYPLGETRGSAIAEYSLVPSMNGGLMVYTLAEGRLNCLSAGIGKDDFRLIREISLRGERVETFEVFLDRNQKYMYGWYRLYREDHWELILFSIDETGQLIRENTGVCPELSSTQLGLSPGGTRFFTILKDKKVLVYRADGGSFVRELDFDAPLRVQRYISALQTEGFTGLLIGHTDTEERIYGVSHERSGAPVLKMLVSLSPGMLMDFFFTGNDRISLVCRDSQTLRTRILDMDGGTITEEQLPLLVKNTNLFYPDILGENRFYIISGSGEGELARLLFFRFEKGKWNLFKEIPVPWISPELIHSLSPLNVDNETLFLASPDLLLLLETGSQKRQTMEIKNYSRSIKFNGLIYLAVSSGNGISLYRIEE